jgi:hypothetical protein
VGVQLQSDGGARQMVLSSRRDRGLSEFEVSGKSSLLADSDSSTLSGFEAVLKVLKVLKFRC